MVREVYKAVEPIIVKRMNRRFEGVVVGGLDSLRALGEDALFFYVSTHKSHVDYIVIGMGVYQGGLRPPLFIAGNNLNKGFVGKFFSKAGAEFIKRDDASKDYLRGLCDKLTNLMLDGNDEVLFVEAGRSYDGKIKQPRPVLLRVPIQVQKQGDRPIYVVPTAVSYDLVLEDIELADLVREDRKEEWRDLRRLMLSKERGGKVYLDFGEPISVEEFLKQEKKTPHHLGKQAFGQAARLYRVTPPALTAVSVNGSEEFVGDDLIDGAKRKLEALRFNNANLKSMDAVPLDKILERGLELLERRGIISNGGGRFAIERPDVLQYYANTLDHLLVK